MTNALTRIDIPGTGVELPFLLGAIAYASRMDRVVYIRPESSHLADFSLRYGPTMGWRADLTGTVASVNFQWKEHCPDSYFEQLDKYYDANINGFWTDVGFPASMRGYFLTRLHKAYRPENQSQILFVPQDRETYSPAFDLGFWGKALTVVAEHRESPVLIPGFALPVEMRSTAPAKAMVTDHTEANLWEIVTELLRSRMYVGCYGFYAQLAVSLGVPTIIVTTPGQSDDRLHWKIGHSLYLSTVSGDFAGNIEGLKRACNNMERMLVFEC